MLDQLTNHVQSGGTLSHDQIRSAVANLIEPGVPVDSKAGFLTALTDRGETVDEIAGFARELRDHAVRPPLDPALNPLEILDVCGMGGDRLNTFNISTAVALLVAAAGVPVAKHGNRAVTSQAGSADVLEALGVPVDLEPAQAVRALREHGFAFFFAPKYHPAFKNIAPARKLCAERGHRTIFNVLGPLLNPIRPGTQLVGVPRPELAEPIARVLQSLNVRRAMVVCGKLSERCLDELSVSGPNTIAEFYQDRALTVNVTSIPTDLGQSAPSAQWTDLAGGDRKQNAEIIWRLFQGQEPGPKRDVVLLNAGAALFVAGRARSILDGRELAADVLDSGKAAAKLKQLVGR